jgi:hypothetical protein
LRQSTKAGQIAGFALFFASFSCTLPAGSRPVFSQLLHVRIRLDAASEIYFSNCPAHGGAMRKGHMPFTNDQVEDWLEACKDDVEQHRALRLLLISRRRCCRRMTNTKSSRKPIVGMIRKSVAAMQAV